MMNRLIDILHSDNYSCVVACGDSIRTFCRRGVADLYDLLHGEPELLKGASVADKVIGKGAAALMIQGGVKAVYADLISEQALALFNAANVEVEYRKIVHHIENRDKSDWCPLEKRCIGVNYVADILPVIDDFIVKMRGEKI